MKESSLVLHARTELEAAGLMSSSSDYGGGVGRAVLDLIQTFGEQGHSGFSAGMASELFAKLSRYEPLSPLTGKDSEWQDISANAFGRPGLQQNLRCSRVFRENGQAYDIDGIVWQEPNGSGYTNLHSRVTVVFPYTPKTEYRPSSEDPGRKQSESTMRGLGESLERCLKEWSYDPRRRRTVEDWKRTRRTAAQSLTG